MAKSAKQLREERAALIKKAQKYNEDHADAESGVLTAEDQTAFDQMLADSEAMLTQAVSLEKLDAAAASLSEPLRPGLNPEPGARLQANGDESQFIFVRDAASGGDGKPTYTKVKAGARGTADYNSAVQAYLSRKRLSEEQYAALQSDNAEQAGYLVASEQFVSEMLKEVDDLVFVRRYARIHTVPSADALGIRKRTQRAATFAWSEELTVSDEDTSLKFGKRVLTPHHLSGQIRVSRDLLKRSMVPVDQIIREEFSRDAGELMEDGYLTGDGNKKPLGVFTASADGISTSRDVNTGSATGITADGIQDAIYALKGQYRSGSRGALRWLFHRTAIKLIAKLKDTDGHYMFRPGMGVNGTDPDSLRGIPMDESERAPSTFTNGNYFGLLANWRYYEIADALDMEIQVLNELDATTNQVRYIGRLKTDGMPTLEEAFVRLKCST